MTHHDLKSNVVYFQDLVDYKKRCDIRLNDREFNVGDTVTLHEGQQELTGFKATGRTISCRVSYIDTFGLQDGFVCMSLDKMGMLDGIERDTPEFLKDQAL